MKSLDEVDTQLLNLLQEDGRITNAELAKRVGLSPPSVLQRVRALEQNGFILGYTALLDPMKMGYNITVFASVSLSLHQDMSIERFRKAIQDIPEVQECYNVSGEYDFLLKILVVDMHAYELVVREKISRIRGIRQINSSFVFGVTKHTTAIPIKT